MSMEKSWPQVCHSVSMAEEALADSNHWGSADDHEKTVVLFGPPIPTAHELEQPSTESVVQGFKGMSVEVPWLFDQGHRSRPRNARR